MVGVDPAGERRKRVSIGRCQPGLACQVLKDDEAGGRSGGSIGIVNPHSKRSRSRASSGSRARWANGRP
jgi:hypothetical protein